MIRGTAATATDPAAGEAARAALAAGGSAADAVIAGFLAAGGARPGVLLAPAVALVAGSGVGARAFDGRAAQPGRGAARPRGFVDVGSVPDAARVAVPRSLAMLSLLHGYVGRARLRDLARAGVTAAERAGAEARAELLRHVGAAGVAALQRRDVMRALVTVAGPVAGGTLTEQDLTDVLPADADALVTELDGGPSEEAGAADLPVTGLRPPWPVGAEARPAEAIVACDGRGVLAALAYAPADDGVPVPDLDLALGRDAVPVRRGVPRVAPGTLLPAAAPIAILLRGRFAAAVALEGLASLDNGTVTALAHRLVLERGWETTLPAQLGEASEQAKARLARAVVRDGRDARTLEVASSARLD